MGAQGYRPIDNDRVTSNTDILGDLPQRLLREDIIPIIARQSQNASNVNPVYFEYFQRIKTGRRCSCFEVEAEPAGICPVCFGTGVVGGYNKRGTKTVVFDVTYPEVSCANTTPDYNMPTRPVFWSLIKTAVYGTLDFDIPIRSNIGLVDMLEVKDYQPEGTSIAYYIKSPSETDYESLTLDTFKVRLGQQKVQVRVVLKRVSPKAKLPKLISIRIAYMLIANSTIRVNIPRVSEGLTLDSLGIYQSFGSQKFWLDNTLKNVSTEDWLYNTLDGTRWKINTLEDNKPAGILTSWDLSARLIQNFESYAKVPVGTVTDKILPDYVKSIQTDQEAEQFVLKSNANHTRSPGNKAETTVSDGPHVTTPGQTDTSTPLREV